MRINEPDERETIAMTVIETERLALREATPDDAPFLLGLWN